jgi:Ca2+-binding RTX toxin-like protein
MLKSGTDGDDVLEGTAGQDTLTGEKGKDVFVFSWGFGFGGTLTDGDRITDYEFGEEIQIERVEGNVDATLEYDAVNDRTELKLDFDGDGAPDRTIYLDGDRSGELQVDKNCCGVPTVTLSIKQSTPIIEIRGTSGDDFLAGSTGADTIFALAGNDSIFAGEGDDLVYASDGDDLVGGGDGDDTLGAGEGNDTVFSGLGADVVYAAAGEDLIFGGEDDDELFTGTGGDTAFGGSGADRLFGFADDDRLGGGDGDDTIGGGAGDDTIYGGAGNDVVFASEGADVVFGGSGDDVIYLGAGDGDADLFVAVVDNGVDTISGFEVGIDKLDLTASGISDAADLTGRVSDDVEGNAVIDLGSGLSLTLIGVAVADVGADLLA